MKQFPDATYPQYPEDMLIVEIIPSLPVYEIQDNQGPVLDWQESLQQHLQSARDMNYSFSVPILPDTDLATLLSELFNDLNDSDFFN